MKSQSFLLVHQHEQLGVYFTHQHELLTVSLYTSRNSQLSTLPYDPELTISYFTSQSLKSSVAAKKMVYD
jgi:hypothetical protein